MKIVVAVGGHFSSERHLDSSVTGAAEQSTILRVPPERQYTILCDESKTLILSTDSFIYLVIEAL